MMAGVGGIGGRVQFNGDGGKLFGTYLMYLVLPMVAGYVVFGIFYGIGIAIASAVREPAVMIPFALIGMLALLAAMLVGGAMFANKFYAFYYEALSLDGQRCEYTGTTGELHVSASHRASRMVDAAL